MVVEFTFVVIRDIRISRLFAAQDKMKVGGAVILDEIHQSEEVFFIGKPLNGRNVEHIRLPLGAYRQNLQFDFLREHADDFELVDARNQIQA